MLSNNWSDLVGHSAIKRAQNAKTLHDLVRPKPKRPSEVQTSIIRHRVSHRTWNEKENDFVKSNAGIKTASEMAKHLGKTESAVRAQACRLGVSLMMPYIAPDDAPNKCKPWNARLDQMLVDLAGLHSVNTIALTMGRTVNSVRRRAHLLDVSLVCK